MGYPCNTLFGWTKSISEHLLWMVAKSISHHLRNPGFPWFLRWCERISSIHSMKPWFKPLRPSIAQKGLQHALRADGASRSPTNGPSDAQTPPTQNARLCLRYYRKKNNWFSMVHTSVFSRGRRDTLKTGRVFEVVCSFII